MGNAVRRVRRLALALLLAVAWSSVGGASGVALASPTDQSVAYQQSAAHAGNIANANLTTPLTKQWTVSFPDAVSHPLIANGMVFVTAANQTVYALNQATGATVWSHALGGPWPWSGLAYDRGRVFTLSTDGVLTAFDAATGSIVWSIKVGDAFYFTSDPTAVDGIVYAAGSSLVAVRERGGRVLWSQPFGVDHSSPTVDGNAVYVTYVCNNAQAYDRHTGEQLWSHVGTCNGGGGRTSVVANGTVFSRGVSANLMLSASTGSELGAFSADPAPALAGGTAFMLSGSTLKAIASSGLGATSWQFTGDGNLDTAPLAVGSLVFVGSFLGELYGLNAATGATAWSTNVGVPILAPDEVNVSQPLNGLGASNGTLIVPAGSDLIAYRSSGAINSAPANLSAPTVDGYAQENDVLAADVGIWSKLPSSYAYQWQRCDGAGANCANVGGATGATITLAHGDIGSTFRVSVVATNPSGSSAPVTSAVSVPVIAAAPVNQTPPAIVGEAREGEVLVADPGTWSGTPTDYTFQWRRCFGAPTLTCFDIAGETDDAYLVGSSDVGYVFEVRVTATNGIGDSDPVDSAPTQTVIPAVPVNQRQPSLFSGDLRVGSSLFASVGLWSGSPTSYRFQWFACNPTGTSCPDIPGATSGSYLVREADLGIFIGVEVVATNAGGDSDPADSDAFGPVRGALSANLTPPTIAGVAQEGQLLTASPGTWSGSPTGYGFQWYRCVQLFPSPQCTAIVGATASTYDVATADVGRRLFVGVTAINAGGESGQTLSAQTSAVTSGPPLNRVLPTIVGRAVQGQTLTANPGTWSSTASTFRYLWKRCTSDGTGCVNVATTATYQLTSLDLGQRLVVELRAVSASGRASAPAASAPTDVVVPPVPTLDVAPSVVGKPQSGHTVEAAPGGWGNTPTEYAFQWKRCNADGGGCSNLAGETGSSYGVVSADVGRRLVVEVVASNAGGASAPAVSSPTAVVLAAPVSTFVSVKTLVGRDGVLHLYEKAHDPGRYTSAATFRVSAHGSVVSYGKGSVRAAKAGTVVLVIRPTTRARRALSAAHRLRVRITVTFRSALGGSPRSHVSTLTVNSH